MAIERTKSPSLQSTLTKTELNGKGQEVDNIGNTNPVTGRKGRRPTDGDYVVDEIHRLSILHMSIVPYLLEFRNSMVSSYSTSSKMRKLLLLSNIWTKRVGVTQENPHEIASYIVCKWNVATWRRIVIGSCVDMEVVILKIGI